MFETLQSILYALLRPRNTENTLSTIDLADHFNESAENTAKTINAAFLITLTGAGHPMHARAKKFLSRMSTHPEWKEIANFYVTGLEKIKQEIEGNALQDNAFRASITTLNDWVNAAQNLKNKDETAEKIWSVFFPEAVGIRKRREERERVLRKKRSVNITKLNPDPISDTVKQVLFTSNVILTLPPSSKPVNALPLSKSLKEKTEETMGEEQVYWFDHPIQIGVEPDKNEVLYGLRGLEEACAFEKSRSNTEKGSRLACVLSVSVTHKGLHAIARQYLKEAFAQTGDFHNLDVYAFSEIDTEDMIHRVLAPAASRYLKSENAGDLLGVFGVDGEYGRHYSFLKAIAAFWSILIDPLKRATFKIDLDQVFPQDALVEQTGASAFEHFKTPLWGASGTDTLGQSVDLGMIAGALVNESDINTSLFTPDVVFPNRPLAPDEYIFSSQLPQALSTVAEMMTRYDTELPDGNRTCIQRIHITGGTNGILTDRLFRYRPFTPSFIGRAEDQAYILSVLTNPGQRLAYVHKDGLIMRHDKKAFAQEAITSARVGTIIGDYVRILYFSAYAKLLSSDISTIKNIIDPFTGCFVSKIPITVVYLRFALKAASLFDSGQHDDAVDFVINGAKRISSALKFVDGKDALMKRGYEKERVGWHLYYDTLSALKTALQNDDDFALKLQRKARKIISGCML